MSVEPDLVAAEVFAAIHPGSSQKLRKDIVRPATDRAMHRYVFFAAPEFNPAASRNSNVSRAFSALR